MMVMAALFLRMDWKNSYKIMRRDARNPDSPNSGFSMAAAAGALGVKLKKIGYYEIGEDLNPLKTDKISEAIQLTKVTIILFLIFSFILYGLVLIFILNFH
ncbi:MAG: cobalamin biosynthesis protein, partial [Methanobacterium sp.]